MSLFLFNSFSLLLPTVLLIFPNAHDLPNQLEPFFHGMYFLSQSAIPNPACISSLEPAFPFLKFTFLKMILEKINVLPKIFNDKDQLYDWIVRCH